MNPKYESAINLTINGENDRAINLFKELRQDMKEANNINDDYAFLLKKIISMNKIRRKIKESADFLKELDNVNKMINSSDINKLFEVTEYIIINLTLIDPKETINYINDLVEKEILPKFFNHIFFYYLSVISTNLSFLILKDSVSIRRKIIKQGN